MHTHIHAHIYTHIYRNRCCYLLFLLIWQCWHRLSTLVDRFLIVLVFICFISPHLLAIFHIRIWSSLLWFAVMWYLFVICHKCQLLTKIDSKIRRREVLRLSVQSGRQFCVFTFIVLTFRFLSPPQNGSKTASVDKQWNQI